MRSIAVLLAFMTFLGSHPAAADEGVCDVTLFEFEVEDQFEEKHTHEELLGQVSVLVWADRKGSAWSGEWEQMLSDALQGQIAGGLVEVRGWAHTRGAPFFVKGSIRRSFPKERDSWSFIDWKGNFQKRYEPEDDGVAVYVFDREGCLVATESGQEVDPEAIARLTRAAQDVLLRDAGDAASEGYSAPD